MKRPQDDMPKRPITRARALKWAQGYWGKNASVGITGGRARIREIGIVAAGHFIVKGTGRTWEGAIKMAKQTDPDNLIT